MSTTGLDEATETRTFRGRTLEELLPQIREELGPDAIVVRQRDGLMGGVGGFFQQRFVEVDAIRAPVGRIDVYDEEPPTAESFAALLADAEDADPVVTAAAFAPPAPAAPAEDPAGLRAGPVDSGRAHTGLAAGARPSSSPPARSAEVVDGFGPAVLPGISGAFAARLAEDAEAHELPFSDGDQREALRRALARRIPVAMPHRAGGLAVAFAGPGSTSCADALATAYVKAGRRAHAVATIEQARTKLERGAPDALLALDLPPIPDAATAADLASRLGAIEPDEILMVLPADAGADELRAICERIDPLDPTGVALRIDVDDVAGLGAAIELACTTRLPIAYVLDGVRIAPADAGALAERLLP